MGSSESTQNSSKHENGGGTENAKNKLGKGRAEAAIGAGAAVAAALVGGAIYFLSGSGSGCEKNRKTMKAPGRGDRIYRDEFEDDPATYFRNLRKIG
ncbi:Regulator of nonsense transcripts 3B like [Quillaja saponaria]|uniref:Regulator of nonsense transcripts 3B like n=1 Tax=Quillaja saponaria TaxID=32244 RepID=A0AAD7PGD3_QUISA|nr:Regulator of nonsense transcripts 3B like [Quillaja saponaria]